MAGDGAAERIEAMQQRHKALMNAILRRFYDHSSSDLHDMGEMPSSCLCRLR
jgi:hypothetical protein